ncbi:MAG: glycoside hydrolase family 127 protein [Verrucomicrobiota bacterium]|nr:glycoside hydrolase family 127 protein [Verrucomicrobiota bacterium]
MNTFAPLGSFSATGDLWTRLCRNLARMEEEKYWPANLFQREKEFTNWPGDTEGRTILAWVLLAQATGHAPRYLDQVLKLWPKEVNERGYFGKIYQDGISEQQLSSHGWVLRALAELERWRPNQGARALALPIIENLFLPTAGMYGAYPIDPAARVTAGQYSGTHSKQIGDWILSTDVGCFVIGMDGLIDAYDVFRDERLVPMIDAMLARFLEIDLAPIEAQTHATLTALRGLIRWAEIQGRPELIAAAVKRYALYTDLAWTEHYANYNWFNRPLWTEPCAMVDSLMVVMALWQHTGESRYLEHAHLIWFNALGHGQRANGGFGCDNCPGADGSESLSFSVYESHWCCTMRGGEGLARMTQYQVAREGSTLTLPFLLSGDYADADGLRISIESGYPLTAKATIKVDGNLEGIRKLRIYLPVWIKDCLCENGTRTGEWLEVDVISPLTLTLEGTLVETSRALLASTTAYIEKSAKPGKEYKVFMRGPLVLAGKPGVVCDCGDPAHLQPIYQGYLDGVVAKESSGRKLLFPVAGA